MYNEDTRIAGEVVLNVLTQKQYDGLSQNQGISSDEIYLITDEDGNTGDYLPLTGGILTKQTGANYTISLMPLANVAVATIGNHSAEHVILQGGGGGVAGIGLSDRTGTYKVRIIVDPSGNASMTMSGVDSSSTTTGTMVVTGGVGVSGNIYAANVYGAVWNDFAEFREGPANIPGYVFSEVGDDTIELSRRRLQPGSMICSDTYGFAIGETDKAITPIAVAGRVLAYPMEDREEYRYHIGGFVGASEDGRVTIMTPDEVRNYPESIIGTISAVPDYEEWGAEGHKVRVDGRVWIKVK